FQVMEALKNPSKPAQTLIDGQVARLIQSPVAVDIGLGKPVKFQIKNLDPKNFSRSLYSKDANLSLVICYSDQIRAEATGLYFRRDGTPEFKNVKVQSNQLQQLLKGL